MQAFRWQKLIQNHKLPSFFCTNTTVLHQALWLGLMTPDSNIFPQVVPNLLNQWWGNLSKLMLRGSVICDFYCMFCGMGTAQLAGSIENMSWYLVRSWWAASASSGAQESRPLKSSSSNNLPCLCLTLSLGVWGSWDSSAPSSNCSSSGGWAQVMQLPPWPPGFSSGGSVSMQCCSLWPQLLSYCLASTWCVCSAQWGPVVKNHPQFIRLVPWC